MITAEHLNDTKAVDPNLSRPWLLVFDLDGTLIDSSRDLCAAVNAALGHVGRQPLPQSLITSYVGDGAATLVRRALNAAVLKDHPAQDDPLQEALFPSAFTHFLAFYREHKLDTTCTYPGVPEALHVIRERHPHLPMAVLTNKPERPAREICSALDLAPFFFANYGGDSFPTKKPAPDGLLAIIEQARSVHRACSPELHNLTAAGVVMIGDSAADVLAARACGVRSLGCLYGLSPEELQQAGPDALVRSPLEWPSALGL